MLNRTLPNEDPEVDDEDNDSEVASEVSSAGGEEEEHGHGTDNNDCVYDDLGDWLRRLTLSPQVREPLPKINEFKLGKLYRSSIGVPFRHRDGTVEDVPVGAGYFKNAEGQVSIEHYLVGFIACHNELLRYAATVQIGTTSFYVETKFLKRVVQSTLPHQRYKHVFNYTHSKQNDRFLPNMR